MKRTGNSKLAVVGWGRGMGHSGHMYLADAVITQAADMKADPYFFVSKTVGKDDPLLPEEKLSIYQTVFPQQKNIFTAEGNLNQALQELAKLGYQGVVLVVGADQKESFKYLEKPNKEGVPVYQSFGFSKLKVISRQETRSKFRGEEGPRATPMREILLNPNASDEEKYQVWRRDMPSALSDEQVADLMKKAQSRLLGTNKKPQVAESRIMDRTALINAYYVSTKGDRHRVAERIPYYLLDKLVGLLTKKYNITMNDIEVRPADKNQYRRTHQPELAEGMQCTPNEVAELLYNAKPEIFTKFGDEFVMDAVTQACEQHQGSAQEVAAKVVDILKQGISEGFDKEEFRRHMKDLEAREELRKTDPVSAKALDLRGQLPQQSKKKPEDDSMSTSDPRHPQYAYTQAGQHNVDEGSELPVQQHKSPYEGSDDELRYTTMFLASPNSAQRFAKHIISKGGKARIGKRGQDYYVYHNMPMSKEDWRKSEQQGLEESPEEALKYATQAHAGQTRSGGDPYITHPMRVADHIRKYKQSHNLDALISAAYLHDTIEDTDTTQEVLHDLFGGLVASLVKELTSDPEQIKKMGKAAYLSHKMAVMSSYGLVIKLADRLDNVKDITTARTPQWRAKYAAETNQILDYIEKTRALSGTHKKLISLIRAKLAEIDTPQQGVAEGVAETMSMDEAKKVLRHYGADNFKTTSNELYFYKNGQQFSVDLTLGADSVRSVSINQLNQAARQLKGQGVAEAEGISRRGILKGIAGAGALGAAGKASAIAGAFPTPSHQAAMYKAAADSNAAQARADAAEKAKRDAQRLKQGTSDVERLNKINYHGGKVTPTNAEWDGDSDFMYLDGTQYSMASRMPIKGDEPRDMKLISTKEGRQVYIWTRYRMKGDGGHYFYPAPADSSQINEFAPGNGDDGLPYAEYQVYQCNPEDQFEWIGGPLYQTDNMGMAHKYAYEQYVKHRPKAFMIWQERSQGSRGNYGVKGQSDGTEDDMTESSDYIDEK